MTVCLNTMSVRTIDITQIIYVYLKEESLQLNIEINSFIVFIQYIT